MAGSDNVDDSASKRKFNIDELSKDPLKILQMLSRLPPVKSTFLNEDEEDSVEPSKKPVDSPVRTISPLKPQFKNFTEKSLETHKRKRFSDRDIKQAERNKIDLQLFKKKHRHLDDVDETLSTISKRSHNSFSRFDRVFDKDLPTQQLLESQDLTFSTQERVNLQRQMDAMEGIETQQSLNEPPAQTQESLFHSVPLTTQESIHSDLLSSQESLFHSVPLPTQETVDRVEREKEKNELKQTIPTANHEVKETSPMIPHAETDDVDFGMDDNYDEDYGEDNAFTTEEDGQGNDEGMEVEDEVSIIPPKRVTQGNSFISKKMKEPVTRYKKRLLLPHVKTKAIFSSKLSFNKKLATSIDLSKATSLFCDQLVDDIKSYKNNQPEEEQAEITDKDIILLMQRQRIISDKSSLEALAQKHLPREYVDLICQSALAHNELYPGFNQKYKDDIYYYNYDNIVEDEDE